MLIKYCIAFFQIPIIMLNQLGNGKTLNYTASGAIASGAIVPLEDTVGIAIAAIASGETGAIAMEGIFRLPKNTTSDGVFAVGQKVYFDASTSKCTADADDGGSPAAAFVFVGYATAAAIQAGTTVDVLLAR
jgi:predicted RecA/RadA family phage recombinase